MGPDLLSFGPFFLFNFFRFESWFGENFVPPNSVAVPNIIHIIYSFTHSLVIYALFFALLWFLGKKSFAKLTLGWLLHILVDIPTHSAEFFPTPFLWPISNFHVDGIPWSNPVIFIPNVILIIILYSYWYLKRKK
ncbi:MAG: hypothetical protein A2431_04285 [Candidatus Zambryskibacteria bacterium RIFOXYC1_FULL_39_10]|uniref:Uncharacterized protein n=1 Tax=Candidatus Zambryskibacteria bacterium RIFOXYC1_FULL_39_10 TaxID=1802779 RepID=A0A1G2V4H7_9BACT|nr:MAG: hypothetical protein A2431_04285 [Candidatus Zambryskibacteria bacterium RIFOXYC1_FULL_39_10]OHB16685.1 MAG: hypothetical protein A2605_00820 [Candidatus Zambryskibacteria bacterium RIFOXYD1_FULL_39_35]